jgi:hypothetical protein
MKRILLLLALELACAPAWSQATLMCKGDVSDARKTEQLEMRNVTHMSCAGCREVNKFPQDFRNIMWNWAIADKYWTSTGYYILRVKMTEGITYWDNNILSVPVCNDHGQCATTTVELEFNTITVGVPPLSFEWNTSIKNVHVIVERPNGSDYRTVYTADRAASKPKFPVPANSTPDIIPNDQCRTNLNKPRARDQGMIPVSGPAAASLNPEYYESHDRWWEEEAAYGGRVPTHRCGTSSVSGGGSTTTCGWFW